MWLGVFSLLLSLFSPLIALDAADVSARQDGEDQQCEEGMVYDEATDSCVPETPECNPGEVYDPNQGGCVPETPDCGEGEVYDPNQGSCVAETPDCGEGEVYDSNTNSCVPEQADDPVGIQVEKRDCLNLRDSADFGLGDLQGSCGANQRPVTMTHGGDNLQDEPAQVTSYHEWIGAPAGNHWVYEQIPEGYGEPRVFCSIYDPQYGGPSDHVEQDVENGNAVGWNLAPGEYVYCYWFNIQSDPGYGEIHLTKYDCATYEGSPDGASWSDLQADCEQRLSGVQYQLYQGQNQIDTQDTDSNGEADFDQVPPGSLTIAEVLPEGYAYALVFCSYHPIDQQNGAGYESVSNVEDGFYHPWEMEAGYALDCLWFNFKEPGGGNIHDLTKFWCPPTTEYGQDRDYYDQNCEPYTDGADFDFEYPDGSKELKRTDGNGSASWSVPGTGDWSMQETIPDGYGDPVVYCRYAEWPDEAAYNDEWTQYTSDGGYVEGTYEYAGVHIECSWYNIQMGDEGGNTVDFYKYGCAYDSPLGQNLDYYLDNCEPVADWSFDVSWDGGGSSESTNQDGLASWAGIPTGSWTGSETVPDDYGQPKVWCRYVDWPDEAGYDNNWFPYDPSDGQIQYQFEYDNVHIECYWFNFVPEDGGGGNWIDFYKYECTSLPTTIQFYEVYLDNCHLVPDWEFELQWEGNGSTQTTDSNGHAEWSGIPQGQWSANEEELPEDYGTPVVYCWYVEWPDGADVDDEREGNYATDGYFEGNFAYDGLRLECHWFNFPPEDGGGNTVDFYKYLCPLDTPRDSHVDNLAPDCAPLLNWQFSFGYGEDEENYSVQATDSDGYTSWSGVPSDVTWQGSEKYPDEWNDPVVWCRYIEWPDESDATGEWFSPSMTGGGFEYDFPDYDGMHIECYWFNFGDDYDDYNHIDFYKYACAYDTPKDQDYDYYPENCEPVSGWNFNVSWEGGGSSESTGSSGWAGWSNVPQGTWSASESLPGGYGEPIVYCRWIEWPDDAGYDDSWQKYDAFQGYFEYDFDWDGLRIECYWFNFVPDGGYQLDFYKRWCSEEATYDSSFEDLIGYCQGEEPAEISLTYGDSTTTKTAEGDTPARWEGVPIGSWTVEEKQYDGWGQPVIWCQYVEWPDEYDDVTQDPFLLTAGDWQATYDNQYDGVRLSCVIFNIPYEQNWFEVTKWYCSDSVTMPYDQSADNLLEECKRYTEGVDFNLDYSGGSTPMTTDGEGNAEWDDLPGGDWTMTETVPSGYGDPVVWCRWMEWPEGTGLTSDPFKLSAPHGEFSGTFDWGGLRIHCDVFNIPDYDPGWITVYKWFCAYGVPKDSSPDYLRDECELAPSGVEFSLDYGMASNPGSTDQEGKAEWDNVPIGSWTLRETNTSGYDQPVVYCQWTEWTDAAEGYTNELFQPEMTDYGIRGSHEYPGLRLVCYFFNFEYEGGDHEIVFVKFSCAPGSDYGNDLETWWESCPDKMDGASFTLVNEQGTYPKTTSGGNATWSGLQDGTHVVQESVPAGWLEPLIWCYQYEWTPGDPSMIADLSQFEAASAPDGRWETTLEGGPYRVICYVFNIPGDDNTVTVFKYNCDYKPVGYNTLWQWQEACPTQGNDITFTLDTIDGQSEKVTADGKAEWTGVSPGEFSLTENPYAGYGESVWWCNWTAYVEGAQNGPPFTHAQATGGVYHGNMTMPGTSWVCYVFNIPDDESKIVVYKYNCPEGAVFDDTLGSYQEACTEPGDGIEFTLDNSMGSSTKAISGGSATWYDVPQGPFTLTEQIPPGYGEPVWWCGLTGYENGAIADGFPQMVEAPGGVHSGSIDFDVTYYFCYVFNFPEYDREVTVYKWYCPEGLTPESQDYQDWKDTCTTPMSGVGFELDWGDGSSWKNTSMSGKASWYGIEPGEFTLTEQYLPGYESPYVFCSLEAYYEDDAAYAEGYQPYSVTDRSVSMDVGEYAQYTWVCHFFNIPKGPGEITIYKWYCPPGYDVTAWGADPTVDCTQATDGIDFVLDRSAGPNLQATTGDAGEGAVHWGDLSPGNYSVSEVVPGDVSYAFIWDCVGGDIPAVQPTPLTWGSTLLVEVAGGDSITCNWYNVPDPEDGWVTLYKYQCWTKTFTSELDCELYEFGASFELFADGGASQGVGTTNAGGSYTWDGLEAGEYTLDEISHTPCKITSTKVTPDGKVTVQAGQGTVVKVYNCSSDSVTTPVPGGKIPTKYPNTGIEPEGSMPVVIAQDDESDEPDDEVTEPDGATPTAQEAAAQFYAISCLNDPAATNGGRSPAVMETEEATTSEQSGEEAESDLPPFLQQAATESPPDPVSTEEATEEPGGDEAVEDIECERGSVPEQLVIDSANVNYEIEVLEIVDGVMQAPSGPNVVSWYKETARLGEQSNIVIAGHVNWWGVPEGPFFHLIDMQEGDRIEITGEDGNIYVYEVQWVRQESNLEAPDPGVVGPTGEQSLTLITCGGEWDASISEYNERTVVRAVQVDVVEGEATTDEPDEATPEDLTMTPLTFLRKAGTYLMAA
jgi:sortase (surface protein transpeptidase)